MFVVRVLVYMCEVCCRRFPTMWEALGHEDVCLRSLSARERRTVVSSERSDPGVGGRRSVEYRPCRRFGDSRQSYEVYDIPCGSVVEALNVGRGISTSREDFLDRCSVVRWFGGNGEERGYELVPDDIIEALKGATGC